MWGKLVVSVHTRTSVYLQFPHLLSAGASRPYSLQGSPRESGN